MMINAKSSPTADFALKPMSTMKVSYVQSNAPRQLDAALSFVPAAKAPAVIAPSELFVTPIAPVSWSESSDEWLDTPAAHCSPLDDY
jgi:hypothetical protein